MKRLTAAVVLLVLLLALCVGAYGFLNRRTAALDAAGPRPALEVSAVVVQGHPVDGLLRAARGADLLVVGSRGSGGFRGLLLGSVSRAVRRSAAAAARCRAPIRASTAAFARRSPSNICLPRAARAASASATPALTIGIAYP